MIKKLPVYISLLVILSCAKDNSEDDSSVYVSPPSDTINTGSPSTTVIQYTLTVSAGEGWIRFTKIKDIDNDGILELYNTSNPYSDQNNYLEWEIISSQLIKVN